MMMPWNEIKLVIFDLDGTLYHQSSLRKYMRLRILYYLMFHPFSWAEIRIVKAFREIREELGNHTFSGISDLPYERCAEQMGVDEKWVRKAVGDWIYRKPLRVLGKFVYKEVPDLFDLLKSMEIKTAVLSDYEADDKLHHMHIQPDLIVASTDPEIDRFKPDPKGVYFILDRLSIPKEQVLFIGDREDRDGTCAKQAGVSYLQVPAKKKEAIEFYKTLIMSIYEQKR